MSCLDAAEIARVVTLELDDPHVSSCIACRRRLDADRTTRAALRSLPVPALSPSHKRALAAELIATLDHRPRRRRPSGRVAAGMFAAAAAFALAVWPRGSVIDDPIAAPAAADRESIALASRSVAADDAPVAVDEPALAAPRIAATTGTRFDH